jgi:hypothetical protein
MKPFATCSEFFSRMLRDARLAALFKLTTTLAPDLIEVRVPHPDLDLNNFWAFRRTSE